MKMSQKNLGACLSGLLCVMVLVCGTSEASRAAETTSLEGVNAGIRHPGKIMIFGVARAGSTVVAVGIHGMVVLSADNGRSWEQSEDTPVTDTLTNIAFADAKHGWAIGHGGVVLHTIDGGRSWMKVLDGKAAAQLALDAVNAEPDTTKRPSDLKKAKRLAREGPDKPFLDVLPDTDNPDRALVVGAYNLAVRTSDGGKSWEWIGNRLANPRELHLYGIAGDENQIFLVGEQGLILKTSDEIANCEELSSPYDGTFFGLYKAARDTLVVFGLGGKAFWSIDRGENWQPVAIETTQSISAGIHLKNGNDLLATQGGQFFLSSDNSRHFSRLTSISSAAVSGMVENEDGSVTVVGLRGAMRIPADLLEASGS